MIIFTKIPYSKKLLSFFFYVSSLLCFLLLFNLTYIYSQTIDNKIATNWHFGNNISLNFSLDKVSIDASAIYTEEGSCSISDNSGKLLFYTNGTKLYNFNNEIIENGDSLLGHQSSTQSALAIKQPNSTSLYYLFTVTNIGRKIGFNYSVIDMNENNGLGKVVKKNILLDTSVTERLAATLHFNQKDYWISVRRFRSNEIASYLLSENGINPPVISKVGKEITNFSSFQTIGQMKFSPNGNKIAIATFGSNFVEIFDFDKTNGKISNNSNENRIIIENSEFKGPYGLEFSPNSNYLYITYQINNSKIVQFNISTMDSNFINSNYKIIGTQVDNYYFGSLQLTPNYKILVTNNEEKSVGIINFPNKFADVSNYIPKYLEFENGICKLGLPNFEANIFANYTDSEFSLVDENKIEETLLNFVSDAIIETSTNNSIYNKNSKSLILHQDKEFQKGAVWTKNKVKIDNFETFFKINLSKGNNNLILDGSPEGADGFAFVIQDLGNGIIGENAAGIGYSGIPKSIAIEFDCFNNNFNTTQNNEEINDPNGNHIAIMSNGIYSNSNIHNESNNILTVNLPEPFKSDDDNYYGKITYSNKRLSLFFDTNCELDKPIFSIYIDIDSLLQLENSSSFIGFTASTGNAVERCELVKWSLKSDSSLISSLIEDVIENSNQTLVFSNINISNQTLSFNLSSNKTQNQNSYITDIEYYDYLGKLIFKQDDIKLNIGKNIIKISEKFTNLHNPIFISFNIKETNEVYNFKLLINE